MKKYYPFMASLIMLSMTFRVCLATPQTDLISALQQREQKLDKYTFRWQQKTSQHNVGLPPDALSKISQAQKQQSVAQYQNMGMDEQHVREAVQSENKSLVRALSEASLDYSHVWLFQRYEQSVLVSGSSQDVNIIAQWRQLYSGNAGLKVIDAFHTVEGQTLPADFPVIWQSSGDSVRHISPLAVGSELTPEHSVMLAGFNPLALHGAKWELVTETPDTFVMKADYLEQKVQYTAQVTLSRSHDNAPSAMTISQRGRTEDFSASSFKEVAGTWIPDNVEYNNKTANGSTLKQLWALQETTASQPISLQLPDARQAHDYRLLGPDLDWRTLESLEMRRSHSIVDYKWPGNFLPLSSLVELHNQQYPGEALSSPTTSASTMQFMGGTMALLGAVWMFKRRGSTG
jgi:hypothetical protein